MKNHINNKCLIRFSLMKSSNSSLTFLGRAGAFPGWLLGERGLIQALRRLYRLTHVGQLGLKRSSAPPHAAQLGQPCSAPLKELSLRSEAPRSGVGGMPKVREQGYTTEFCSCQHHGTAGCGGHPPKITTSLPCPSQHEQFTMLSCKSPCVWSTKSCQLQQT